MIEIILGCIAAIYIGIQLLGYFLNNHKRNFDKNSYITRL